MPLDFHTSLSHSSQISPIVAFNPFPLFPNGSRLFLSERSCEACVSFHAEPMDNARDCPSDFQGAEVSFTHQPRKLGSCGSKKVEAGKKMGSWFSFDLNEQNPERKSQVLPT
jgi:hypothetical protein